MVRRGDAASDQRAREQGANKGRSSQAAWENWGLRHHGPAGLAGPWPLWAEGIARVKWCYRAKKVAVRRFRAPGCAPTSLIGLASGCPSPSRSRCPGVRGAGLDDGPVAQLRPHASRPSAASCREPPAGARTHLPVLAGMTIAVAGQARPMASATVSIPPAYGDGSSPAQRCRASDRPASGAAGSWCLFPQSHAVAVEKFSPAPTGGARRGSRCSNGPARTAQDLAARSGRSAGACSRVVRRRVG
jgi:hypothetical protein